MLRIETEDNKIIIDKGAREEHSPHGPVNNSTERDGQTRKKTANNFNDD